MNRSTYQESPLQRSYNLDALDGQWVSDTGVIGDALTHSENVVIEADPGTGKSYAALDRLGAPDHPFIFVADTIASAEDLGSEHNLPVYYSGQPDPGTQDFITIPHHAHKDRFVNSEICLVVDEWHSLVADYGFKDSVIDKLVRSFEGYGQVIGLTGTYCPVPHPHDHVEVTQDRDDIPVTTVSYEHLWSAIVEQVEARPNKTHFISLYDKNARLKNLQTLLERRGFEAGEIMAFNADTTDEEEVQALMQQNVSRDDTEIIISTYVQGFSIKDTDYMVHIAPLPGAQHSAVDIAQVAQRFRNTTTLPINLYWNFPSPEKTAVTDRKAYQSEQKDHAATKIRQYRRELGLEEGETPSVTQRSMISAFEKAQREDRSNPKDEVNLVRRNLKINQYQVHHNVYSLITDNIYKRPEQMEYWLRRYGLTLEGKEDCPIKLPETNGGSADVETVDQEEFMDKVDEHLNSDYVPRTDEAGQKILFLAKYYNDEENIRAILEEHGQPTQTWNKLKEKIKAQAPLTELGANQSTAIREAFDVGEKLTSKEVLQRMHDVDTPFMDTSGWATRTAMLRLHRYFDTKYTSEMREGKKVGVYKIVSDDPLPVPLPEEAKQVQIGENSLRISPRSITS